MSFAGIGGRAPVWAAAGLVVGLLAGWTFISAMPKVYTATAVLRVTQSMIPEHFAPDFPALTVQTLYENAIPEVLSRVAVANLIDTYDLLPDQRGRLPLEDVVQFVTKQIDIHGEDNRVRIAFSYPDAVVAQKVCSKLVTSLVDLTIRQRGSRAKMTLEYLKERARDAGWQWQALLEKPPLSGAAAVRLKLDLELARRAYEEATNRVNEAQTYSDLETRKQGPTLEVMDLPVEPEHPDPLFGMSRAAIVALSGVAGLVIALATFWIRRLQPAIAPVPALEA